MKLKTIILIVSLGLFFWVLNTGISRASEILLNDGTKVQGTIIQMNDTSISVNTSSGTLVIPRSKIAEIKLNDTNQSLVEKQVLIHLNNGNTVKGKLLKETQDYFIIQLSIGQLVVERKNVASIQEANTANEKYNEENSGANIEKDGTMNNPQPVPVSPSKNVPSKGYHSGANNPSPVSHNGWYAVGDLGTDIPTGPDQPYSSPAFDIAIGGGYQFMDYLGLELVARFGLLGSWSDPNTGYSGDWRFLNVSLDLKPMIPLDHSYSQDIFFLVGVGIASLQLSYKNNGSYDTEPGASIDLGFGYEYFIETNFAIGAALAYHNHTFTKVYTNGGTLNLPYREDASQTSLDVVFRF